MNWLFIFLIIFIVSTFFSYLSRKRKLKSGFYWKQSELGKKISLYKNSFSNLKSSGVNVKDFNYKEYFKIFPFCSDFKSTEANLKFDVLVTRELNEMQHKITKHFDISENTINKIFNTSLNLIALDPNGFYNLYVSYVEEVYSQYTILICEKIIKYYNQNKNLDLKKIDLYKKINNAIDDYYIKVNNTFDLYWNSKIADLRSSIMSSNSSKFHSYSEAGSDSFNSFFGSGSKSSNNSYNKPLTSNLDKQYKILNVSPNCTNEELKKAYREMSKKYHPDINKSSSAPKKMAEINAAYDAIKKERKLD